jgi:hypothetical protein
MPSEYGSPNRKSAKIIDNPPAKSVTQALANSKKQVDAAKRKSNWMSLTPLGAPGEA